MITEEQIEEAAEDHVKHIGLSNTLAGDIRRVGKKSSFVKGAQWMQEQIEPKWIPVTEKLPEKHKWVITSEKIYGLSEPTIFIASYEGNRWRNYGGSTSENITHWMPLPEPHKTARKEANNG